MTWVVWLICIIAAIGFAFDTYTLLMFPLAGPPALAQLLHVDRLTKDGFDAVLTWTSYITWASAICGGVFGLLGGYMTDLFGRRRVLTWSILLYAFASAGSGFATSAEMLLVFRCLTFIGVCVEFVAAVAWLSELFPEPKQREAILGFTQAFASVGGLLVANVYLLCSKHALALPEIVGGHDAWRYALLSGLIPAIPLILIRPFLPESPAWREKKLAGKLQRPSIGELFRPSLRRTTIVTALLFACCFGVAFGTIQLAPQIIPGLLPESKVLVKSRAQLSKLKEGTDEYKSLRDSTQKLSNQQQGTVAGVMIWQEVGGLVGRVALAVLALVIVRRGMLLRMFQVPGLIIIPLVFYFAATGKLGENSLEVLKWGMAAAGFFTIAQFSFWGNYLPRVYPTHLRGTGESFAANIGGRMFGTAGQPISALILAPLVGTLIPALASDAARSTRLAYAAGTFALLAYAVGLIASFWLPEPPSEALPE